MSGVTASDDDKIRADARASLALARHYATRGQAPPDVWVVVTAAYRVPLAAAAGWDRAAALASGAPMRALLGVEPSHVEIGFRHALDAKRPS